MIKVDTNTYAITIIRGDSGYVNVPLFEVTVDDEGEEVETPYELKPGEKLRFAMAKKWGASKDECLILRDIDENGRLYFLPEDTKPLSFGSYKYDLEFTDSEGFVDTVLRSTFKVIEEVY